MSPTPVAHLSQAQARVFFALVNATKDGWPATVEEIRALSGHASKGTVHVHLQNLIRVGAVVCHPRNGRGGFLPADFNHGGEE